MSGKGKRRERRQNTGKSWLQLVTEQSWEPELLISGLAIYSTLQLPGLLWGAYQYYRFNLQAGTGVLDEALPMVIYALFTAMAYLLTICFVIHFIIRAFWVGFIGLKSAYPQGIRYRVLPYSRYYIKQARKKLGSADEMAMKIDRVCSLVFSIGFAIVLIFISTAILYIGFFLLFNVAKLFLSAQVFDVWSKTIMAVFLSILGLYVVVTMVLNMERFRSNPKAARWHFFLTWNVSSVMMPLVYKPVNFISLTFLSNVSTKRFMAFSAGLFALAILILMTVTLQSTNVPLMEPRDHFATRSDAATFDPAHYESLRDDGKLVEGPVIERPEVSGRILPLFLPYSKLLDTKLGGYCGESAVADTLSRYEQRRHLNRERIACALRFFRFEVNDTLALQYDLLFSEHRRTGQPGYRATLYLPPLEPGKYELAVRREEVDEADRERREEGRPLEFEWTIPFWTEMHPQP